MAYSIVSDSVVYLAKLRYNSIGMVPICNEPLVFCSDSIPLFVGSLDALGQPDRVCRLAQ